MNAKVEQTPETNQNPVLSVEINGTIIYSNEASEPILNKWGVRIGETLPSSIVDLVQKVISRNSPEKIEVRAGKKVYLVVFHPLPEHESVNISGFDISDQKELEEKLWESEERFRSTFDDSALAMALVDPNARFLQVNDAFCRLLGYEKSEMEGSTFLDFTYPLDMEPCIKTYKAVINREKPFFWLEKRYIRKDGKVIWCEVSSSPVLDSKGYPIYTVSHIQDITERKEAEEALKKAHDTLEERIKERTVELEKAYNSLKESEDRLAEAQQMAHIGNWYWDIIKNEIHCSDELYCIFGFEPRKTSERYNDFLSNHVHPDDRKCISNALKDALSGKPYSIDFRFFTNNRKQRIAHVETKVFFDEKNNPIRMRGILQDITERKEAEERSQYLANIVESSDDAIGTMSLDNIITSWNKGAEKVYGYRAEEVLGKSVSILAPPHLKNETKEFSEKIIQGKESYQFDTLRLKKNRNLIYVSITLSPVFDIHGKLTAISFIVRDITRRKKAEEKLRESEEKYRNIVETANEGILITNNKNIITYVNKKFTEMLRYDIEEVIGKPIWNFISEEYKPIVKLNLKNRKQEASNSYEIKSICKNGSSLWILLNAKPLLGQNDRYMGAMSMLTDITKRKEAEEALANIETARKKEIHHRIKNNLQVISSLLDLQADKFKDKKNIKDSEVLEAFKESQDRVISMALIHEGLHKEGESVSLNFSHYIEELADNLFLTYRLGNECISLDMDIEKDTFFDMDIAVPLGLIVNELLSNSLKYAFINRDNGQIKVKLHRVESGECKIEGVKSTAFIISVSDNGVGIPEDLDIENLDSLGLQLVTALVEQLDGEVELKRDNGTEFTIRFTVTEEDNQLFE